MNARHTAKRRMHSARGFSMIDALVAIVVMATALLALAVLQGSLTRNTADARARSQIAQFGDGLLDQARQSGYDSIVGSTITPSSTTCPVTASATKAQQLFCAQQAAGVSNLSVATTVSEYAYADGSRKGATTACTNAFMLASSLPTSCGMINLTPRYKTVTVTATWTDASGASRTLAENTIVSPTSVDTSQTLVQRDYGGGNTTTPTVRTTSPVVPGVIPIAISSDTSTAATNPKPELSGVTNATSYNVLTYKSLQDALAGQVQIQQRIETNVIGCSCQYGQALPVTNVFAQAWRPTYWDGTHYVSPDPAPKPGSAVNAGQDANTAGNKPSVVQSPLCNYCCRDHHDYSADRFDGKTDDVVFDPFRSGTKVTNHVHQRFTGITSSNTTGFTAVLASDTTNPYLESCRMIRVDGLWHTATDLNAEQVGLLATQSSATAGGPTPTSTQAATNWLPTLDAETQYQTFVKDYFSQKVAQAGSPDANALFHSYNLDDPPILDIAKTTPLYMNARGLYLDNIEAPAAKQILTAKQHCTGNAIDCVLPFIPFTSINLTEVANWSGGVKSNVQVANGSGITDFGNFNGTSVAPIRGKVTTASGGGVWDAILMSITKSNTGIAASNQPIDPDDVALVANYPSDTTPQDPASVPAHTDIQHFKVLATNNGDSFTTTLSGLVQTSDNITNNDPLVAWYSSDQSDFNDCTTSYSPTDPNPNPYTCQTDLTLGTVGIAMKIAVQKYNTLTYQALSSDPCSGATPTTLQQPVCTYNRVTGISVNGVSILSPVVVVTNANLITEQSMISVPLLPANSTVVISFGAGAAQNTATAQCDNSTTPATFLQWNKAPCQP